ncbi:translocation/assembly module TamB domain-containing protein [Algoriphagus sp. C2-7]|uniref:Translocation/assembly module TamB domain-containing protein n=1 Tax=Algoriphagus sediminis TaxID=3057113 RepID=A0ABT7Y9L0_9BACT|nr:translocation/assembly module TamB domain-containing protein [Algoriphagus sediminis]
MLTRVVFFLLLFFILLVLALQLTSVQNFLIDKVTSRLNASGNFTTEIGHITISWWDMLKVEDFQILDHHDSTMIGAELVHVDFDILSIIPPGDINLDQVRVEKGAFQIITHEGDSLSNLDLWTTELSELFGSDSSSSGTGFGIDQIELRQMKFSLLNFNEPEITEGLNYNQLRVTEITGNAGDLLIKNEEISIDIDILTGRNPQSDLQIQELSGNLTFNPNLLRLENTMLKTQNSEIKDYLSFEFDSIGSFSNFLEEVTLEIHLDQSTLALADIRLFVPSLAQKDDRLILSGNVRGTISDFASEDFLLELGEKTKVGGSFELKGLPDIDETFIRLSLENSIINSNDLKDYLNDSLLLTVSKFRQIELDADFAGYLRRFDTNGELKTSIGDISGRVRYDATSGQTQVVSNVEVNGLNLGVLTDNPELFQRISLDGRVDLEGDEAENLIVGMNANISQFGFNGYNFSNIQTNANYGLNLFEGNIEIDDPNLILKAGGTVNLEESVDSIRLAIELDSVALQAINLTEKEASLSGFIELDTKGITLDDLEGIGRFQGLKASYDGRFLDIGDFYFQSLFAGGTRTISINSDYLVAGASGQFNLQQMSEDLPVLFDQYISIILNEEQPIADLEKNFSDNYSADININLLDINPIIQLFEPNLKLSPNTIVEGAFYQTPENTVFNIFTSIDELTYNNNSAKDINIDFNTSKIINSEDILASFYIYSKEQYLGEAVNFSNLGLEAIWDQNQINLDFSLDQDSTQSSARINAAARFSSENTTINFLPSKLQVLNQDWSIDDENEIVIKPQDIEVTNLKIANGDQFISLEGRISENPEDELNLAIQNVDVSILNTLTPQNFDGIMDGVVTLTDGYDARLVEGNLGIEDLEINAFPIGNVVGSTQVDKDRMLVNLQNVRENTKTFDLSGSMGLEENDLEIQVELAGTSLVTLEPFLSKYVSELSGTATGNIEVSGTLDAPVVVGSTEIEQGKMKINYLQTNYQLDGGIVFRQGQISFQELVVLDSFGNEADFKGGINHENFSNFYLDIDSNLSNFQVLNTSSDDNETFYGEAYVTGTLEMEGSTNNLDITARAKSEANTKIFIPLTSDDYQVQEDFINIINIRDTVRIKEIEEVEDRLDIQNVKMNFIMDITPDALAEIIIDPRTNEGIQGRGQGVLTLNIDTRGNFELRGTYEIVEGLYNFSLYNVVNKQFNIRPGGRITWFGDPYSGIMDLTAEYVENVSLQPILATGTIDDQSSQNSRRYPLKVTMDLRGELLSPDIEFGFDFSEFPSSGDFQTTIAAFQNRIANDEQEMNRQVFSVILTRSLSPEGQFSGVSTISSSLGQLLSAQLNNFISQVDQNLEVDVDLNSLDENTLETFQLSVAYTFLDGRLRVSRDGGFTNNNGDASAASIIGDWQAEYTLTEDGIYRIRIFNKNNFNTFTSLSLSQNVATYGVALSQNVSFNSFSELFKKITRKKDEELLINDNDDFLRYRDDYDWKPIDLDRIDERYDSLQRVKKNIPPESDN